VQGGLCLLQPIAEKFIKQAKNTIPSICSSRGGEPAESKGTTDGGTYKEGNEMLSRLFDDHHTLLLFVGLGIEFILIRCFGTDGFFVFDSRGLVVEGATDALLFGIDLGLKFVAAIILG
jgi:hypothetical protein